ncbi:MAG: hypothetical protein HC916_15005 [Coleofasciculaceae cyanobacterium SM2_1_6]|nr:hypothetical protein [Coleofasciculaceae cyanobacterium SM2_1_6]
MVMEYKHQKCNDIPITISQGELRDILRCIETEFVDSEIYLRTLSGLGNLIDKSSPNLAPVLNSLGREAIRLTFRAFAEHFNLVPIAETSAGNLARNQNFPEETISSAPSKFTAINTSPQYKESQFLAAQMSKSLDLESASAKSPDTQSPQSQATTANSNSRVLNISKTKLPESVTMQTLQKKAKKPSKLELAAQLATQERETGLLEIGAILSRSRNQHGWSINYLHSLTFIPVYQIAALEAGDSQKLPEDIYLRGFIRRLATALHLDGATLLQKLPQPDAAKEVLPSWYHSQESGQGSPIGYITPVHLYLGYTTLLAGALGGLAMIAPQEQGQLPIDLLAPADSSQQDSFRKEQSSSNNLDQQRSSSIAPPESSF